MTPFDLIKTLCNDKDLGVLERHEWDDLRMGPYMLNRWVSMTSPSNARIVNEITNSISLMRYDDAKRVYMALASTTLPFGRMKYLKKTTKEEKEKPRELSKEEMELELTPREVEMYGRYLKDLEERGKI